MHIGQLNDSRRFFGDAIFLSSQYIFLLTHLGIVFFPKCLCTFSSHLLAVGTSSCLGLLVVDLAVCNLSPASWIYFLYHLIWLTRIVVLYVLSSSDLALMLALHLYHIDLSDTPVIFMFEIPSHGCVGCMHFNELGPQPQLVHRTVGKLEKFPPVKFRGLVTPDVPMGQTLLYSIPFKIRKTNIPSQWEFGKKIG